MKNIFQKSFIAFSAALLLTACGQNEKPREMYCGLGMSAFEVIDAKTLAAKFTYPGDSKALLAEVTNEVTAISAETKVEVYFYFKDAKQVGIYIVAPDDKALVEKISCTILKSTIAGLPETRKVVFYTNESTNLVAAVKTKPKV
ncbi:hypothetical protein [Flavobacterium psychrotrophum]|uniref:hypothetical protein n=1 Tax=Flavobacterium psychrotrophum TaxID=2294119 RepID=UPI000E31F524|nr:hypothetical protein [Flavobacterium psychrotrophum]